MGKEKITAEMYNQCKIDYKNYTKAIERLYEMKKEYAERIDEEIRKQRELRAKVKNTMTVYERRKYNVNSYKKGLAYELFGKRQKDLTPEELREYNNIKQKNYLNRKFDKGE